MSAKRKNAAKVSDEAGDHDRKKAKVRPSEAMRLMVMAAKSKNVAKRSDETGYHVYKIEK